MGKSVLIVTESLPPVYGGADVAAYRYFKYLQHTGFAVKLIGNYNSNVENESNLHAVRGLAFPKKLKRFGTYYLSFLFLFVQLFFFLLARPQLKIIHAFNGVTLIVQATTLVARLLGRKVILETSLMGSDDPNSILNSTGSWRHLLMSGKKIRKQLYRMADTYISKSPYLTKAFVKTGIENFKEIPYSVDTKSFMIASPEKKRELRNALGIPHNKMVITFVGGITERKGVDVLVAAFRKALAQRTDLFLSLVGPTEKYDQKFVGSIRDQVNEIGTEHARMVGQVERTQDWMMASDIYVLPSWREGFPISIIEALCCGLLVIGSDIPEIKGPQIEQGVNGLLFEKGNVHDSAAKIIHAVELLETEPAFVHRSASGAIAKYDIQVVATQYHEVYQSLNAAYTNA